MADTFTQVLTDAIEDIAAFGFDSATRVNYWINQLRQAALASLMPPHVMEQKLRDTLGALYRREIENGGALKIHREVSRFTLQRIAPQLRAELDRRIVASADLIKLNRTKAVEETIQRFSGWATSIPVGGSRSADKPETKAKVRKALAQLPFEERRVLIDQGQKFTASINETVAVGGGAIAGIWQSRWRQAGYDYREDHKERDGLYFIVRGNWAMERGLMKPAGRQYIDEIERPGERVFCRCAYRFVFNLRDLPEDMLTKKGKEALEAVRIRKDDEARADNVV